MDTVVEKTRKCIGSPIEIRKGIGALIQRYRKIHGLTQIQLAKRVGFSGHDSICRIESGVCGCSAERLYLIAEVLGVKVSSFFPENKKINPKV